MNNVKVTFVALFLSLGLITSAQAAGPSYVSGTTIVVDDNLSIYNAAGDLAVGTGAGAAARLAVGAANSVLISNGTTASWSTDPTIAGDVIIGGSDATLGAPGVKLTGSADGDLTILGIGDGAADFDESLTLNMEDTENTVGISSATGVTTLNLTAIGITSTGTFKLGQNLTTPPAVQVIGAGGTVAADACGGLKTISAASAVSTDTTNTVTAPAAGNAGCCMDIVNIDTVDTITLDGNANFMVGGSITTNVALTPGDAARVCSNGTTWYLTSFYLTP